MISGIFDQVRIWWDSSTSATRVISVGLGILVVVCLAGAIVLATTPEMEDLFTNLDPRDAAAIAAKLDDEHVKYQMADGETSILVPGTDKDRLRMEMIRDGLPAKTGSVVGSDYLDKIGMGTTSDVQTQYIQLANEAELSQTISSMNEVSSAAVHISQGSNTPFADTDSPPTASVVIGLKPGDTLSSDQILGIANLVAKAVTGLDVKNVEVVDTNGNQLWDGEQETGPSGLASNRMMAEKAFADDLRKQMQGYLDAVLGAHKSLVSVHAELNFNQVHSTATTYAKGPVLSSQESDEQYKGTSPTAPTVPAGAAGNTGTAPQYTATTNSGRTGDYDNSSTTTNYDPNKTETETEQAPGSIERLNVAVLIDSKTPQTTVSAITSYITTLAGVTAGDPSRAVTVQQIPFSTADADNQMALMKAMQAQERTEQFIKIGAVALVAIILLVIYLRSSKAGKLVAVQQAVFEPYSSATQHLPDPSGAEHMLDEPMSIEQLLGEMPPPEHEERISSKRKAYIPEIEEHTDVKLESVRGMVKSQPQSVALLMKGWISDDAESNRD
jgi:flagellar M-ring protein FliF